MSLYVRLQTNYWSNRKTIRLQALIGESAFWVPPRLWCYAADNQPDGNFSKYSAQELALLIGYSSNAQAMLEALQQAGFLTENMVLHDWEEHNGYHKTFSDRAKAAADTRWEREREKERIREEKRGKDKTRQEGSIAASNASSIPVVCDASRTVPEPEPDPAETIYQEYPHKVGKPVALKSIEKAIIRIHANRAPDSPCAFSTLLAKTKAYAAAVKGTETIIPHPSTWFNQERYNDHPSTWARQEPKPLVRQNGYGHPSGLSSVEREAERSVRKLEAMEAQAAKLDYGNAKPATEKIDFGRLSK